MGIKIFISYSHKDETHKDSLEDHLSTLKTNGQIETWNDRKIAAGQKWEDEISDNLKEAEIILFLMSASFLASEYCQNIEAKTAIERHKRGEAVLIPVVVRPSDWVNSPFGSFQALPKDAQAITKWEDEDEAWLNVIQGIRKVIESLNDAKKKVPTVIDKITIQPTHNILSWIDDTEVVLTHRSMDKIHLSDIYVPCDIQPIDYSEKNEKITTAKVFSSNLIFEQEGLYLISGDEQQGKTTLLKQVYKELLKRNVQPVYFDAREIKNSDLSLCFECVLTEQYTNYTFDKYGCGSKTAILIDDLDQIGLNKKFRALFLSSLARKFNHIIATCNTSFSLITAEVPELNDYKQFELRGFGHQKRAEIVEKWVALGVEQSISEEMLFEECDDFNSRLDAIIRKNIVPPKPIYVLILLQMFEAYTQQNLELTSYGHCYQQLVYQAFDNAGIPKDEVDRYLNVLTELAWTIHLNQGGLNSYELNDFFANYKKIFLGVDEEKVMERLRSNSILSLKNGKTDFKYPYLFYFFAAKKIAESYSTDVDVCEKTKLILNNLHREDSANILVFVTHHTKDKWVLESIQSALSCLFDDQKPAVLSTAQLTFLSAFIAQIPNLIMEQRGVREERKKHHELLDSIERNASELDPFEENDILAKINKTFKGMEIAGQIVRNRHATLTRETLLDLTVNGSATGLRFLNYFICLSDIAKHEVVKLVELTLSENPNFTNEQIKKEATKFFLQMTYGVINGVIRKIASSIGSKEASEIYDEIGGEEPTPAEVLLKQAIQLQFKRRLDIDTISYTVSKLQGNPVCIRILKEMIIQHVYMFPVDYKDKQRIDSMLELSVKQQQLMESKRRLKG